ncbi:MAG TPA: CCA tRNA nucleotidyltransferase [Clostridia bacterium]
MDIPVILKEWLTDLPFPLYITGGYVRNTLLGLSTHDIDIAGTVSSEKLSQHLPSGASFCIANSRLDTSVIIINGVKIEYTPFRTESYDAGEHTPKSSEFIQDPKTDSFRRDFTCNALYYDLKNDKILDFHNGIEDINNKILRAVNSPDAVFSYDGLRILRMIRFAAELGFEIEKDTFNSAKKFKHNLEFISKERIREEFDKILVADTKYNIQDAHYKGLKLIGELGIWKYIIPEIEDGIGFEQNKKYHSYDVYNHLLETVRISSPQIRLAALMHDIGKPASQKKYGNMHHHSEIGVEIAKRRLGQSGLKYPNSTITKITRLIDAHMYDLKEQTRPEKMRLFVAKNYDILDDLVELVRADTFAHATGKNDRSVRFLNAKKELIELKLPKTLKELKINGNDLINKYPDLPRNKISIVLEKLWEDCIAQKVQNQTEQLLIHANKIIQNLN